MMRRFHRFLCCTSMLVVAQALALASSFPTPSSVRPAIDTTLAGVASLEDAVEDASSTSASQASATQASATQASATQASATQASATRSAQPQIRWQRSLKDALALQRAENCPLLVAINLDGESASDRIVTERYRNPEFVAWTERFVCVVASPSRHNARDWNEKGVRIPCSRLGEVTCGEHIALEPVLFDKYLGAERVSPRHALIQVDGTKSFDLFLLFDLRELDQKIAEFGTPLPAIGSPSGAHAARGAAGSVQFDAATWRTLASGRTAWHRAALEAALQDPLAAVQRDLALLSIRESGDAGSFDALRVLLEGTAGRSAPTRIALEDTARAIGATSQLVEAARTRLTDLGATPGWPGYGDDAYLLELLAREDKGNVATRQFLLMAYVASTTSDRAATSVALKQAFGEQATKALEMAVLHEGGPVDLVEVLDVARRVGREFAPRVRPPKPSEVSLDAAEAELAAADEALAKAPEDLEAMRRFGRATYACASARRIAGGSGAGLLFQDAQHWLGEVARARPDDWVAVFELARAAYWAGDYATEEAVVTNLLRLLAATYSPGTSRDNPGLAGRQDVWLDRIPCDRPVDSMICAEALRWIGDACAMQVTARISGDPASAAAGLARGAWALATVAASCEAVDGDYESLASYLGAAGHARHELAVLVTGCSRFPDSQLLRDLLNKAFFRASRMDLAASTADWISSRNGSSAAAPWYAGYAYLLKAEESRRAARADEAAQSYTTAIERFATALTMEPKFEPSVREFSARAELGQAHAHLLAGRRRAAADAFVTALKWQSSVGALRDGLDREGVDVIDGVLEWHEGHASEVDASDWAIRLEAAVPGDARWVAAVADSELREALRADGRSSKKVSAPIERRGPNGVERVEGEVNEPTAEGDRYMEESISVARLADAVAARAGDEAQMADARRTLAQALRVHAERWMLRASPDRARPLFEESAKLTGQEVPTTWDEAGLAQLRERLNAALGDQRPRFRPGR